MIGPRRAVPADGRGEPRCRRSRRPAAWRTPLLVAALLVADRGAQAAINPADYAWDMRPGAQVPMATVLQDEAGHDIALAEVGAGKPIVLDLGYFHCPTFCGMVRADLMRALSASGLSGADYALVAVSIDPAETFADAANAKAADSGQAPGADAASWHYLTGPAAAVAAISAPIGFHDRYDPAFKQFLHPAGVVVLTSAGVVSSYLQGVGYSGGDLSAAVRRASGGGIAQTALPVLLLCFHFDSTTGRYTLAVEKVLRLTGGVTVLAIGGLVVALHRRRRRAAL